MMLKREKGYTPITNVKKLAEYYNKLQSKTIVKREFPRRTSLMLNTVHHWFLLRIKLKQGCHT